MILGKHTGQIYEKFAGGFCKANLALGASIGIQLTMLPVSLYFFGEVSLVGIFLNLLVLPTVGVVLGSGVIGLLYFVCRSSLATYTEREEGEKNNCFRSCMPGHVYSYMA